MKRIDLSTGIASLIPFLQLLDREHVFYRLSRERDDAVMVTIHIICRRIELEFFDDHIEYSWFDGDESVHDDQAWLYDVLEAWVKD